MDLLELLTAGSYKKFIDAAKTEKVDFSGTYEDIESQYDVAKHDVNDPLERRDKPVTRPVIDDAGKPVLDTLGSPTFETGTEKVARVGLPYQKLIVSRRVGFLVGNPVEYLLENYVGTDKSMVNEMVSIILKDNKTEYRDRDIATRLFSEREIAEIWYMQEDDEFWINKSTILGQSVQSKARLKMMIASQSNNDILVPVYDEFSDMVAFIREYKGIVDDKETGIINIYTKEVIYKLYEKGGDWLEMENGKINNDFGKIPVIYYRQDNAEWYDVQSMIDRRESVISNLGDENEYFGRPILFTKGKITGFANKKDAGKVLEGGEDADVKFISWEHAPESMKLELTELDDGIFKFSQTPDLSFENVKGISAVSGRALKLMFTDAQMAAKTKESIIGEGFQRRTNLLRSAIGTVINVKLAQESKEINVKPVFTPFLPEDLKEEIDVLTTGYQGGIMSRETAVSNNPYVGDSERELKLIEEEEAKELGGTSEI